MIRRIHIFPLLAIFALVGCAGTLQPLQTAQGKVSTLKATAATTLDSLADAYTLGLINDAQRDQIETVRVQFDTAIKAADAAIAQNPPSGGETADTQLKIARTALDYLIEWRNKTQQKH